MFGSVLAWGWEYLKPDLHVLKVLWDEFSCRIHCNLHSSQGPLIKICALQNSCWTGPVPPPDDQPIKKGEHTCGLLSESCFPSLNLNCKHKMVQDMHGSSTHNHLVTIWCGLTAAKLDEWMERSPLALDADKMNKRSCQVEKGFDRGPADKKSVQCQNAG